MFFSFRPSDSDIKWNLVIRRASKTIQQRRKARATKSRLRWNKMTHSTSLGALFSFAVLTFLQFKGMTLIRRELQLKVESKLYFTTTWISTWRWVSCAGFKFPWMSKNGAVQRLILILNSWKTLGCILHPSCLHLTFNNWMKRGKKFWISRWTIIPFVLSKSEFTWFWIQNTKLLSTLPFSPSLP